MHINKYSALAFATLLMLFLAGGCTVAPTFPPDDDDSSPGDDDDSAAGDDDDSAAGDDDDDSTDAGCPDGQERNETGQCVDVFVCPPPGMPAIPSSIGRGGMFTTWIPTDEAGNVGIRVMTPEQPRYIDRAGVVVNAATFFTTTRPFYTDLDATAVGLIHVSFVWPGSEEPSTGACSEGVFDHGGPTSIAVLRDVTRYALGDLADIDGLSLNDRLDESLSADHDNVGIWAFSHPGIAAINALGRFQEQLSSVAWFVGRENPTQDQHCSVELGHFGETGERVLNPLYDFASHYSPGRLNFDMSSVQWNPDFVETGHEDEPGRAFFDLDGDGFDLTEDHVLSFRIPSMYGKRYLSRPLTEALRDSGLSDADWPEDLATPEEAEAMWSYRNAVDRYPMLSDSPLKAMLVFGQRQHVQPLADATSVHSAWDGLRGAGVWVRLNPDQAYADWAAPTSSLTVPDSEANSEPASWADAGSALGHSALDGGSAYSGGEAAGWAAISEMSDRTEFGNWTPNLESVLVPGFPPPRTSP